MLKIGEFSKLSRVSVRMLRHYDELGLLTPASIDPFTGYRYYSEDQLYTAGRIAALKEMGFGLAAIGELLRCTDAADLERHFAVREQELKAVLQETTQRLRLLETVRARLQEEKDMKYDVTLKTLPQRYVASVRMTLPDYSHEGDLWHILIGETAHMKLIPDDPCCCTVTYHDGEHRETDVDAEAQKTVKGTYPDTEHVHFKTVPAVTFAATIHKGPYDTIGAANAAVAAWVRDNGYTYAGPAFNIYHVSPHETQDPAQYITEVCYPVVKEDCRIRKIMVN